MRNKLLLLFPLYILLFSCSEKDLKEIKGSWYFCDNKLLIYEEIHINDSIFLHCFQNGDVLVAFNYEFSGDTIYLYDNRFNELANKYKLETVDNNLIKLSNAEEVAIYKRLNNQISNLDSIFSSMATLEAFDVDFRERLTKNCYNVAPSDTNSMTE